MTQLGYSIVEVLTSVLPGKGFKALHEPHFSGNEWAYVKECIDTGWVSSAGKFVEKFEADLAAYTGAKYAIAVVNGTAALHVALQLAGVKRGDEVLVPALTFVATANAVAYCGATPHFVDCSIDTLGMDAEKLRYYLNGHTERRNGLCINRITGQIIRAVVPMHTFGHPVDLHGMLAIAKDFNLILIEDAAESLGSFYYGQHTGTFGSFGTLSFNGNKTITTGGGGALLTNDAELARHAKHLTTTAKLPHSWAYEHDEIGYNYRLPNLNAALGCAQLEQLPDFLKVKRELYHVYRAAFAHIAGMKIVSEPHSCHSNYWLQAVLLTQEFEDQLESILKITNNAGFMTRPVWKLMHELQPFKNCPRMSLSTSELLSKRLLNLPSSVGLIKN